MKSEISEAEEKQMEKEKKAFGPTVKATMGFQQWKEILHWGRLLIYANQYNLSHFQSFPHWLASAVQAFSKYA